MMRISDIRRKNLGEGPLCRPSEWARSWFKTVDQQMPGWRDEIDAEGLELALIDAMGDDGSRRLDPVFIDALTELLAQVRDQRPVAIEAIKQAVKEIFSDPRMPDIAQRLGTLFRRGLPLQDPIVRAARLKVFLDYAEVMQPAVLGVMKKFANQLDSKECRHAHHYPLMIRPELVKSAGTLVDGSSSINLWAAARRTISETEKLVSLEAMQGLRTFLKAGGTLSQTEAARAASISPATLTRALEVLRANSNRELGPASDEVRLHFSEMICAAANEKENSTC